VTQPDLIDEDLLILRYMNGHDRYWAASKLAPLIGIPVGETAQRLETLGRARLVKMLRKDVYGSEPEFCVTNDGVTAVITRRFQQSRVEASAAR
jgi:hypothetical protein